MRSHVGSMRLWIQLSGPIGGQWSYILTSSSMGINRLLVHPFSLLMDIDLPISAIISVMPCRLHHLLPSVHLLGQFTGHNLPRPVDPGCQ